MTLEFDEEGRVIVPEIIVHEEDNIVFKCNWNDAGWKEICWHCNKHVDWVDFEADHRPNPHSKGGKTSVENGVCAHKICNIKASNKENLAKNWLS